MSVSHCDFSVVLCARLVLIAPSIGKVVTAIMLRDLFETLETKELSTNTSHEKVTINMLDESLAARTLFDVLVALVVINTNAVVKRT